MYGHKLIWNFINGNWTVMRQSLKWQLFLTGRCLQDSNKARRHVNWLWLQLVLSDMILPVAVIPVSSSEVRRLDFLPGNRHSLFSFSGFPKSFQIVSRYVSGGDDRALPRPSEFIISNHQLIPSRKQAV